MGYKHLSLEEREKLYALKSQGLSLRDIGKKLKRPDSTLGRELKRNAKYGVPYIPCRAQRLSDRRGFRQRYKAPLKNPLVFLYVRKHLREDNWSPDEISGRIKLDHPGQSVSYETIYRYIYSGRMKRFEYWQYLTLGRRKRMGKGGRRVRNEYSGKIPGSISIDLRPQEVSDRVEAGHWETDNVIGQQTDKSALSTTVERTLLFTLVDKLADRSARAKLDTVVKGLSGFPEYLRKTVTGDNGAENSYHLELAERLKVAVFFCHAYHSWEKGTNENTNGRLRRYIPKGVSIDGITEEQVKGVERKLNSTPRKKLGYLTPYEKMNEELSKGSAALPL